LEIREKEKIGGGKRGVFGVPGGSPRKKIRCWEEPGTAPLTGKQKKVGTTTTLQQEEERGMVRSQEQGARDQEKGEEDVEGTKMD